MSFSTIPWMPVIPFPWCPCCHPQQSLVPRWPNSPRINQLWIEKSQKSWSLTVWPIQPAVWDVFFFSPGRQSSPRLPNGSYSLLHARIEANHPSLEMTCAVIQMITPPWIHHDLASLYIFKIVQNHETPTKSSLILNEKIQKNVQRAPINRIHHAESKGNYQLSTCIDR